MQNLAAISPLKTSLQQFKLGNFSFTCLDNHRAIGMTRSSEVKILSSKVRKLPHHRHLNGANLEHAIILLLLKVKKLSKKSTFHSKASALSAGYDLASATETKVPAREKALIPNDLSVVVPEGTYGQIAPQLGLAWKHSIDVGAGVIDDDYRGPIGVILFNNSYKDFKVKVGDRIAQLILEKILMPKFLEVEDLDATKRGDEGFGSTGV